MRVFCRRFILSLLALAGGTGLQPACAQIPVTDSGAIAQLVQQVAMAGHELQQLQQQYAELQSVYGSLAHLGNTSGMAPALSLPSVQQPLAGFNLPGIINGTGSAGLLNGVVQSFLNQNTYYRPPGTDPTAQRLQTNALSLAGIEALATQLYQATTQRMQGLNDLQSQIDGAQDVQAVAAVQARISTESNYVQTQQVQATELQTLAAVQAQAQSQKVEQRQRQDADQLYNDTQPLQ